MAITSMFSSSSLSLQSYQYLSIPLQTYFRKASVAYPSMHLRKKTTFKRTIKAVAEEETLVQPAPTVSADEETLVSPSDLLTLFFKAEGTIEDTAVPKLSKAFEGKDGVSDLKVQNLEGIASVELTQKTTVQATGVASNLVEIIQSAGFKLQALYLSVEDEEDVIN